MRLQPAPMLAARACDYDGASGSLQFDWRGVAASAVGAGVGEAIGTKFGTDFGGRLAKSLVAGTAAAVMRGGKIAIQQVMVDAFGQTIGASLAQQ